MEKYEYVFDALESIVVDIQLDLNESEDGLHKELAKLEKSFLVNAIHLLKEAKKYRQQSEKES
jgi:5'-deoxynucleotidase YfbR-like HD superfamily hydrolase